MSVMDLSLTFFNTSCGIYSIPKESKYADYFYQLIIKFSVFLYFFVSGFIIFAPSFILDKLFHKKISFNLGLQLK